MQKPPLSSYLSPLDEFPKLNPPKRIGRTSQEIESKGYFGRVRDAQNEAAKDITQGVREGAETYQEGVGQGGIQGELKATKGLIRSGLRSAGGVARAAFAPIMEAPVIKQGIDLMGKGISKIPGAETIAQKSTEFSEAHPEVAKDIRDVVDITALAAGGLSKPTATVITKTGDAVMSSGIASRSVARASFARDLVMPIENKSVKLDQVPRTIESNGLFKKDKVIPTTQEAESIMYVSRIPRIDPNKTMQYNYTVISSYNLAKAKELEAVIEGAHFPIARKETIRKLGDAALELKHSPLIVGDAQKTSQKLLAKAEQLIKDNTPTGSGVLKARKEYDRWVESQKPNVFDASAENALTTSNRAIRNAFNQILEEKAPSLGIKQSLREQSAIYRALENIAPKAAQEANSTFGRAVQNVGRVLGTQNKFYQTLAVIGVGATTMAALPLTLGVASAWVVYKGGKLVLKPEIRKTIGDMLKKHGDEIAPVDRAIFEGLLYDFSESDQSDFEASQIQQNTNPITTPDMNSTNGIRPSLDSYL